MLVSEFGRPTDNYICLCGFFFQDLGVIQVSDDNSNVWECLLYSFRLLFGSDKCGILIVGVLVIECVKCISANVTSSSRSVFLISNGF